MISPNLLHKGGLGEGAVANGPKGWNASHFSGKSAHEPIDPEALHQKHVVECLWILVVVLSLLCAVLVWGESHGFFEYFTDHTAPLPSWPIGWP